MVLQWPIGANRDVARSGELAAG